MKQTLRKTFALKALMLFAMLMGSLNAAWADEETVTFSEQGYENGSAIALYEGQNFKIVFDKGTNNNAPKYYTTGEAIRTYGGNFFTINSLTSNITIESIALSFASGEGSNAITTDVGTYENGTWTGSASSVKFTIGGTTGHRRISAITVTFAGAGAGETTSITIDYSGITNFNVFEGTAAGTLTATVTSANGNVLTDPAITWSGNNDEVATINASGAVTLVAAGTVTFTASYAGVENVYKPSSKSYTMTVTNSDPNALYRGSGDCCN